MNHVKIHIASLFEQRQLLFKITISSFLYKKFNIFEIKTLLLLLLYYYSHV